MTTYNGHKNWNHWNVYLWLHNDEWLYRVMRECIAAEQAKDKAAGLVLEFLNEAGITHTPDGAPYTKTTIRAAMRDI